MASDGRIEFEIGPVTEGARRLQDALEEAKTAWFALPPWLRRRIGRVAVVLDEHPAGCGLRAALESDPPPTTE